MDTLLPFGLPTSTALYLTLYLLTLALHVAFMNYVLAGTAYLFFVQLFDRHDGTASARPMDDMLRDWLPFMLSAAITAGVAPLLFVQILYERQFYTANLLLFHRWMAILPALMVGFYLLYVYKSKLAARWPMPARLCVGALALACFAFTGWSWTENHLLSLDRASWTEQYASGRLFYHTAELAPRLTLWFVGALPNMALLVGWQLWYAERRSDQGRIVPRDYARLPLAGLLASAVAGAIYYAVLSSEVRDALRGPLAGGYVWAGVLGWLVQVVAWLGQRTVNRLSIRWLALASAGALVALLSMTAVREARRLLAIDITTLYAHHEQAASVGGKSLFITFVVINALAIVACLLIVRTGLAKTSRNTE